MGSQSISFLFLDNLHMNLSFKETRFQASRFKFEFSHEIKAQTRRLSPLPFTFCIGSTIQLKGRQACPTKETQLHLGIPHRPFLYVRQRLIFRSVTTGKDLAELHNPVLCLFVRKYVQQASPASFNSTLCIKHLLF